MHVFGWWEEALSLWGDGANHHTTVQPGLFIYLILFYSSGFSFFFFFSRQTFITWPEIKKDCSIISIQVSRLPTCEATTLENKYCHMGRGVTGLQKCLASVEVIHLIVRMWLFPAVLCSITIGALFITLPVSDFTVMADLCQGPTGISFYCKSTMSFFPHTFG